MRKFIWPYLIEGRNKNIFYGSIGLLIASKLMAVASPYCLKIAVNALSGTSINYSLATWSILGFGGARIMSSCLNELRMSMIVKISRSALKTISQQIFEHMHNLDLSFHRTSSKNTVFAVNRALTAMDNALRFVVGFVSPTVLEFSLVVGMMALYCGPMYFANILGMLTFYTVFTRQYSLIRQQYIRKRKDEEKRSDFFLNESIMNYETVKYFNNEDLEK